MFKKNSLTIGLIIAMLMHVPTYSMKEADWTNNEYRTLIQWQMAQGVDREWSWLERQAWLQALQNEDRNPADRRQEEYVLSLKVLRLASMAVTGIVLYILYVAISTPSNS